jgi:threonine dehydratase
MASAEMVTPASILAAAQRVQRRVRRTPLERDVALSEQSGAEVYLKLENLQQTGSFKLRGATNRLLTLDERERAAGVVTASAGNHALGLAQAASSLGVRVTILVATSGSPAKIAAIRRFPAEWVELVLHGKDYDEAEARAIALARETGRRFVSAYNDPEIMAGQGTIAVEILEDWPDVDVLLVPVGGGGILVGMGCWAKAINPHMRVIGVQSVASPQMHAAFEAGRLVTVEVQDSLADGLAGNIEPGSAMYELARRSTDEMVLVEEREIAEAMAWYLEQHHLVVEGAGAVGIAALQHGRIAGIGGKKVAVVLTGRNVGVEKLRGLMG